MPMIAMMMPILPGKKDIWLGMMEAMNANKAGADAIRAGAGLHERTFLQESLGQTNRRLPVPYF